MVAHLTNNISVTRWTDEQRHAEHRRIFGPAAEPFWRWQERTADALWSLALRNPAWPPQTSGELVQLLQHGLIWLGHNRSTWPYLPQLTADAFRPVAAHLGQAPEQLRQFVDAQLLISAQTTSRYANALYGAAALDLPRRGVVHLAGGMGAIAETLAEAVRRYGGQVRYRSEVSRIVLEKGRPVAVETKRGQSFPADLVVANLTPWNVAALLGDSAPAALRPFTAAPPRRSQPGWGAFVIHVGLDGGVIPPDFPLHHQVVMREPLGEGNSVFLSFSPIWDAGRAPAGHRALTLSTHTRLAEWWHLYEHDRAAYEARKATYTEQMLTAAEIALPGLRQAANLVLPGTPVTFALFTRRQDGWVGGFPQTSLFRAKAPRLAPGLWLVGDSIFPGQSTAAVALGGLRVAHTILAQLGVTAQEYAAPGLTQLFEQPIEG
jgi:phytoene dehydrogenase-like protein